MKLRKLMQPLLLCFLLVAGSSRCFPTLGAAGTALIAWSEKGTWETEASGHSIYSLFPPFSNLRAQLVVSGRLVTNASEYTVTYESIADSTGSINTTSKGKGDFYSHVAALYKTNLLADEGLAGFSMPGASNAPQPMGFEPVLHCFRAEGIPVTPYDDQGRRNEHPLFRLVARDQSGAVVATTQVPLPTTDRMDCRGCHFSGADVMARPAAGWVWDCDPERDYRLNILKYHDEAREGSVSYVESLKAAGYNPSGLLTTVTQDSTPVLCVRCHVSNALPGSGLEGMRPLTRLIHTKHSKVPDPVSGLPLDDGSTSQTCLRCHAGSEDSYLRGGHHGAVTASGALTLQCQSCHGSMLQIGVRGRQGWLDEPNCQSCHTGTVLKNNGQVRYTSAFDTNGLVRVPVDRTFATEANQPEAGLSLYRTSKGHGGLQCAACHGAPHAELPSTQPNENLQNLQLQGYAGTLLECSVCHPTTPSNVSGGPHGMHPVDRQWLEKHHEDDADGMQCQACHGTDDRGAVLSRAVGDRFISIEGQTLAFLRGASIGCYNCHNGPRPGEMEGSNPRPAVAFDANVATTTDLPLGIQLQGSDPGGLPLEFRVVSPPSHGRVSLAGSNATYHPSPDFLGTDTFTFSAWNGVMDSNPGQVQVRISAGTGKLDVKAVVPQAALPGTSVPFRCFTSLLPGGDAVAYDWDFGDGSGHSTNAHDCHLFTNAGDYPWTLKVEMAGISNTLSGVLTVHPNLGPPLPLSVSQADGVLSLTWPADRIGGVLQSRFDFTEDSLWSPIHEVPVQEGPVMRLDLPVLFEQQYFRVRRIP